MTLPSTAEVVVVGGGVVGASIAWHLAASGCRDVVVVDRGTVGSGSTGRATGGFRAQFPTSTNVRLSLLAREKLRRFADEVGGDAGYDPRGYLLIAESEAQLARLRVAQRTQRAAGLRETEELTAEDVRRLNPYFEPHDVIGGVFGSADGFIRPLSLLDGYRRAAERLGVAFRYETAVTALGCRHGPDGATVERVVTPDGTVNAGAVVNAAGAWAAGLAQMAGVTIPVSPARRQVASTAPQQVLPGTMPMTIFAHDGFHLRVRDGQVLLMMPGECPAAEAGDDVVLDGWLAGIERRIRERLPCLSEVPVERARCWSGLYEMSPDGHALLGFAPGTTNMLLANGSSGHGVMHAPALGELAARLLLGRDAPRDLIEGLSPHRFARGAAHPEPDLF